MRLLLPAAAAVLVFWRPARAADTVVVLSGGQPAYRAALRGFAEAFRGSYAVLRADRDELPDDARVVVAIGGRAALQDYPDELTLIYCLAPGVRAPLGRDGPTAEVGMLPAPRALLRGLREAHRGPLKRLGVLWSSRSFSPYIDDLEAAARAQGVQTSARRVADTPGLLDALRDLHGSVDALWVPPDPRLAAPDRLKALQAATSQWKLPYYGATPGFLRFGASATVGAAFSDIGRAAARAAQDALKGRLERRYYPSRPAGAGEPGK